MGWPGNHILLCNFVNALGWPFPEGMNGLRFPRGLELTVHFWNCHCERHMGLLAITCTTLNIARRQPKGRTKLCRLDSLRVPSGPIPLLRKLTVALAMPRRS